MLRPGDLANRLVSASAGVIAVVALATALYTAWITRQQQKMSVWPYVTQMNSDAGGQYRRLVINAGLGPALVRSLEVLVDGKPATDEAILRLAGWTRYPPAMKTSDIGNGTVLTPGQQVEFIVIPDSAEGLRFHRLVARGHLETIVCYCSLYGDCWRASSEEATPRPAPCQARDLGTRLRKGR